jgi:hypothetical protein
MAWFMKWWKSGLSSGLKRCPINGPDSRVTRLIRHVPPSMASRQFSVRECWQQEREARDEDPFGKKESQTSQQDAH